MQVEAVAFRRLKHGHWVCVSLEDSSLLEARGWYVSRQGDQKRPYVVRGVRKDGKYSKKWLHREVMQPDPWEVVHHVHGNGLDNRRTQLKILTFAENAREAARKTNSRVREEPCL